MKVTWVVIFSLGYFAAIYAHPARTVGSDEVEFVPLEAQNGGGPIVDTGVIGGGPWSNSPFDGLFESLAGMMARMRQQMDYLLRRLPVGNGTIEDGPFIGFPNIGDLDLGKGNTTSVTKVIDGHKVVINETSYNKNSENGGAFFKVRIIDVQPNDSDETTEKSAEALTTPPKDVEPIEESSENEIPKNKEDFAASESFDEPDFRSKPTVRRNIETFDSLEDVEPLWYQNRPNFYYPFQKQPDRLPEWESLETFESVEDNSIESNYRPASLSGDTYVNQLMADQGAPTNPDAEVFSNVEYNVPSRPKSPFERFTYPR